MKIDGDQDELIDTMLEGVFKADSATIDSIYSDDVTIWHNYDEATQDRRENIDFLARLQVLGTPTFQIKERLHFENRVVQRRSYCNE